jgi:hypothetical protein
MKVAVQYSVGHLVTSLCTIIDIVPANGTGSLTHLYFHFTFQQKNGCHLHLKDNSHCTLLIN